VRRTRLGHRERRGLEVRTLRSEVQAVTKKRHLCTFRFSFKVPGWQQGPNRCPCRCPFGRSSFTSKPRSSGLFFIPLGLGLLVTAFSEALQSRSAKGCRKDCRSVLLRPHHEAIRREMRVRRLLMQRRGRPAPARWADAIPRRRCSSDGVAISAQCSFDRRREGSCDHR
jgi:hypothetical protein